MAKRAFQVVVLFFAICGFLFVPLGKRTAMEHLQAIVGTKAAQQAASEVQSGVGRLVDRLRSRSREATDEADGIAEVDVDPPVKERRPLSSKPPRQTKHDKPRAAELPSPETAHPAPLPSPSQR